MKKIYFPDIDLKKVKGVLIDLDDTLYPFDAPEAAALKATYRKRKKLLGVSFEDFLNEYHTEWDRRFDLLGRVPSAHHRFMIFLHMLEKRKVSHAYALAADMHNAFFKTVCDHMKPDKKALCFLKECHRRKIPVCVVTDLFAMIQIQKLKALKMMRYVDFIVSNDEVGADKPCPLMFKTALKKMGIRAKDAIMVGDNSSKDIAGAADLGIKTYQVLPAPQK